MTQGEGNEQRDKNDKHLKATQVRTHPAKVDSCPQIGVFFLPSH